MSYVKEAWSSRLGVILAVAGSAVGLGNFLRFPGLAAKYGGGPFMVAYFVSLLLVGLPICWAEWTMGREGGARGFHSSPGIFRALLGKRWTQYLGLLGVLIPVGIYLYYVVIEAWCLGYAYEAARGTLTQPGFDYAGFFAKYTGIAADGGAFRFSPDSAGFWLAIVFGLNFYFIYRGLSKGIEKVCLYGMPLLIVIALIILARVLTLGTPDPAHPELNIDAALGRMWNPGDWSALRDPQLWLAAAGQIFFTLSVGFGVIINYASYLRRRDDVVLSGLTATAANEFCEVGLGGLITVPAAYLFFGAAASVGSVFGLAFNVLPAVFAHMPFGAFFATLFFFLLFIAAITSSLSILQPGIAFLEEGLSLSRKASVSLLGFVTGVGTLIVWWFSKDLKAIDTIDFWIGTVAIYVQGTIMIIVFSWVLGVEQGWKQAHEGAEIRIPAIFKPILRYVTPTLLLLILFAFVLSSAFGWNLSFSAPVFAPSSYVTDLFGDTPNPVARFVALFIVMLILFTALLVQLAGKKWDVREEKKAVSVS